MSDPTKPLASEPTVTHENNTARTNELAQGLLPIEQLPYEPEYIQRIKTVTSELNSI